MGSIFERTELLIGKKALEKLKDSRVAVFGAGGVGGYVIEALVRSGIGELDIIDRDTVSVSNINRQIIAVQNTVGMTKTRAAAERALSINPDVRINTYDIFYGSFGNVVIMLFWVYLLAYVYTMGMAINAEYYFKSQESVKEKEVTKEE